MDIELSDTQRKFREEVRDFIEARLPTDLRRKLRLGHAASREEVVQWHRVLHEKGWAVPHWPRKYGGAQLGMAERILLQDELYRAPAPLPQSQTVGLLGPAILHFGSEAVKQEWLPKLANLDVWFCQGFSEPEAGSDLASLRTSAIRSGDHYVVNGQKTWTTLAQWADWIFCLVRTSKELRKQDGITMLLIDLKSPGVTVRPIGTIDGHHQLNEVFFEDVRVPVGNAVGEEGGGWEITKFLLANERSLIARTGFCYERLDRVRELLEQFGVKGNVRRRMDDERVTLLGETRAIEMMQWRLVGLSANDPRASTLASVLKIKGSEIQQRIGDLLYRLEGQRAMLHQQLGDAAEAPAVGSYYHYVRAVSIYGGSNEIQRELLARAAF